MNSALALLTIEIGIDPEIQRFGDLLLTWHGVFTAVGIAGAVWVAVIFGRRLGFLDDDVYSAALVAIPSGIIGARALYVMERWGSSGLDDVFDILRINEGGISIYGAVLGGIVGGLIYGWFRKIPLRRGLDVAAFAALTGMALGRIGDLINGEHFAEASSLPWAVRYTHEHSPIHPVFVQDPDCGAGVQIGRLCAQHPAVGYEMVGDILIFGLLFLVFHLVRKDGVAFFGFILLYSLMRFGVSELRLDSREVIAGLSTPQVTALFLIPMSLAGLLYALRQPERDLSTSTAGGGAQPAEPAGSASG